MRKYTDIRYPETVELLNKGKGFRTDIKCPDCDTGILVVRHGYTKFLGCSNFPKCTCKIGFNSPKSYGVGNVKLISDQSTLIGGKSEYIDTMEEMYPSGINCKDDM